MSCNLLPVCLCYPDQQCVSGVYLVERSGAALWEWPLLVRLRSVVTMRPCDPGQYCVTVLVVSGQHVAVNICRFISSDYLNTNISHKMINIRIQTSSALVKQYPGKNQTEEITFLYRQLPIKFKFKRRSILCCLNPTEAISTNDFFYQSF